MFPFKHGNYIKLQFVKSYDFEKAKHICGAYMKLYDISYRLYSANV